MEYKHVPVMLREVMKYLDPKPGGYFIDCTLGGGGYTTAIAKIVGENGKVLAIDLDEIAIKNFQFPISNFQFKNNIILANDNFKNLSKIIEEYFSNEPDIKFDGIVLDLGLSSAQLADRSRGFSFQFDDAPINMSFDKITNNQQPTTEYLINKWDAGKLEKIISEYGEERFARRIARKIAEYRKNKKIERVGELVEIIKSAVPVRCQKGPIHFATRTFQALRIATNNELENLKAVLPSAVEALKTGGRLAIISFHSLEDRIVKDFFRKESRGCVCPPDFPECRCDHKASIKIITKKPMLPSEEEARSNPRSRSAKMRVAERI